MYFSIYRYHLITCTCISHFYRYHLITCTCFSFFYRYNSCIVLSRRTTLDLKKPICVQQISERGKEWVKDIIVVFYDLCNHSHQRLHNLPLSFNPVKLPEVKTNINYCSLLITPPPFSLPHTHFLSLSLTFIT